MLLIYHPCLVLPTDNGQQTIPEFEIVIATCRRSRPYMSYASRPEILTWRLCRGAGSLDAFRALDCCGRGVLASPGMFAAKDMVICAKPEEIDR